MKVIVAEKPSVARDIASVVGATNKKDGYFEGKDHIVTYALGHLVTLEEPEAMNPAWGSPWRIEQLPMIPTNWKYRVLEKSAKQFHVLRRLLTDAKTESIICATDAGREGEHIFRLIYQMSACDKPVERLWISSLTADAIKDGLAKLKSASEFDNLAHAASARSRADWIVGLNFTRAYTSINRQLCTIGRVQTPTLNLIVERQKAIDNFQANPFYEIIATLEPGFTARYITPGSEPQTRLQDKTAAQAIFKQINAESGGTVKNVNTVEKKTKPPALYDLLTLQKEANKRFGYTAKETLDIAQTLYEEYKLISYPRTESRHISTDMVNELPRIVSSLLKSDATNKKVRDVFAKEGIVPGKITGSLLRPRLTKAHVDDTKLTDHHAIIPTYSEPSASLPEKQRNIYDIVVERFLSIFLPAEVRDETTAIIDIAGHSLRAKGFVIKDPGWTVLEPPPKKESKKSSTKDGAGKEDEAQQLPPLQNGQPVKKTKAQLKEGKTSAPKPYDDGTLLTAMKNAGQEIDDEDLAGYMKQRGLGTPATRAQIIERLLQTGYIERNKKSLAPTAKGMELIEQVHADLKDIKLTAFWEQGLADMQDGKLSAYQFETDIARFVERILPDVVDKSRDKMFGSCPMCKAGTVRKTPKGAGCNRWKDGCKFTIWREMYGKELADEHILELVTKRATSTIEGFVKKSGAGTYNARLVINEEFKVRLDFSAPSSADSSAAAANVEHSLQPQG